MPRVIRCGTVDRSIVRGVKEYDDALGFEAVGLAYRLVKVWTYGTAFVGIGIVAVDFDDTLGYECQRLHVRGRRVNVVANSMGEAIGLIGLVLGPIYEAGFSGRAREQHRTRAEPLRGPLQPLLPPLTGRFPRRSM